MDKEKELHLSDKVYSKCDANYQAAKAIINNASKLSKPNCKEKPDSSLLLSDDEKQKYIHHSKVNYGDITVDEFDVDIDGLLQAELDHLAKLGNIFVLVDGEFIFLSRYRDYMKGEGK